ncbi:MAG: alpha-amylase family glycosyl hydrolase [Candidatus Cloacimonetes bacterium]|nr:alpha-amylase family glycosyl hydrolase [Candidatus Cloacimonadota bacterium]
MKRIRFYYEAPTLGDHTVGITGDFTSWKILEMHDLGGVYQLSLPLEPGTYRYKLIVDGSWITDPQNSHTEPDPYGGLNSVIQIEEYDYLLIWEDLKHHLEHLDQREHPFHLITRISESVYEIRFRWFRNLADKIFMHLGDNEIELIPIGRDMFYDYFHYCLKAPGSQILSFHIRIQYQENTVLAGRSGFSFCNSDNPDEELGKIEAFQEQAELMPIFEIPDWVKNGIIYQIFPDRFHNGDPKLNQDFGEWYYQDVKDPPPAVEHLQPFQEYYHFVDNWRDITGLDQSPWLPDGKPDWWSFYGGDIPGVTQKLDYLVALGITIIYFNPLWEAKSNHKYDSADYLKIDPHFGTEKDLKELVSECHKRGIKLILDVAFNHTGETFWAFRDCLEKGPYSEYWNWYDFHKFPIPKPLPPDFKPKEYYQCWWGIKDMPDLNYDLSRSHPEENYITEIDKAVPNEPLVEYVLKAARWWISEMDFDGFRLDVPDEVPFWFWELFRQEIKALKPDAWLVGELWHNAEDWVSPKYFDSVMNYAYFKAPVIDYLVTRTISLQEFQNRICEGLTKYPFHALKAMMNLLGSHDTWRIWNLVDKDIDLLKITILFQMTFLGAPHIYYGDEICMHGKKDPDNRRPFNWNWEIREEARDAHDLYQRSIVLRKAEPLLVDGEFAFVDINLPLCVFKRYNETREVLIYINPTDEEISFSISSSSEILLSTSDLSHETLANRKDRVITLPAKSGIVTRFQG